MTDPIRVVVADDSPFVCRLLTNYLQSSADCEIVGTALNGKRAIQLIRELKPDVVTLDIEMPTMDGLEALDIIMTEFPTPVIIVSGISREAAATTLRALNMGAVDFILKYSADHPINPEVLRQEIIDKVKAASRIKVIRSIKRLHKRRSGEIVEVLEETRPSEPIPAVKPAAQPVTGFPYLPAGLIVVGASTGGPVAIRELFSKFPPDFQAGIIVVQHIPESFTEVLAAQLNRRLPLRVKEAAQDDLLEPGLVLVAPGDRHLLLRSDGRMDINKGPVINGHRPSIDVTMQSVAQVYGSRTTGIILTGMGNDGVSGMVAIHAKKGRTFAQSSESCVVNGMPQRAIEKGVVQRVAAPTEIGRILVADYYNSMNAARGNYVRAS